MYSETISNTAANYNHTDNNGYVVYDNGSGSYNHHINGDWIDSSGNNGYDHVVYSGNGQPKGNLKKKLMDGMVQ